MRTPLILGHRQLASNQKGPYDLARDALPAVTSRAPRWVFSQEAAVEITEYYAEATRDERAALVSKFRPLPEVVIEFGSCCVVYVQRSSSLFETEVQAAGYSVDQVAEGTLARVFLKSSVVETYPSEAEAAQGSQAIAHLLYVARLVAADRYVDKVAVSRVRRRLSNSRLGTVSVRWDAPTLRYRAQQAVEEIKQQEERERQARCQHSVREFLRVRNGKVEYVRAHVRGDPSVPRKAVRVTGRGDRP